MKIRFEERGLTRALRRANRIVKRQRGSHLRWTALGVFAIRHGRHYGSPWDGAADNVSHIEVVLGLATRMLATRSGHAP